MSIMVKLCNEKKSFCDCSEGTILKTNLPAKTKSTKEHKDSYICWISLFPHQNPSHPTAVVGEITLLIFNNSRVVFKVFGVAGVFIASLENVNS